MLKSASKTENLFLKKLRDRFFYILRINYNLKLF